MYVVIFNTNIMYGCKKYKNEQMQLKYTVHIKKILKKVFDYRTVQEEDGNSRMNLYFIIHSARDSFLMR